MLPILQGQSEITMTSLQFLEEFINPARQAEGKKPTSNTHFIARVIDELDLGDSKIFIIPHPQNKKPQHVTNLDYDQMMLVGMRESKQVRKRVLEMLKSLAKSSEKSKVQLPDFSNPAEAARAWAEQYDKALLAEKTKAQINDKRTATLMNKASQDAKKIKKLESQLQDAGDYKSLTAVKIDKYVVVGDKRKSVATIMKKLSAEMGFEIKKVPDSRYGQVNTYHIDVIEAFKAEYM